MTREERRKEKAAREAFLADDGACAYAVVLMLDGAGSCERARRLAPTPAYTINLAIRGFVAKYAPPDLVQEAKAEEAQHFNNWREVIARFGGRACSTYTVAQDVPIEALRNFNDLARMALERFREGLERRAA